MVEKHATNEESVSLRYTGAEKIACVGLLLPLVIMLVFGILLFISLTNKSLSAVIKIDVLLMLLVAMSPVAYLLGLIISIVALLKSNMKITACTGIIVNLELLAFLMIFAKSFLVEFQIFGWL